MPVSDEILKVIADEAFGMFEAPREIAPFSDRFAGFRLEDAYRVVEELRRRREARGELVVGRKIGFTNASAWAGYGISGPIWNYLYNTTTLDLSRTGGTFSLGDWPNVRMEAEIVLSLFAPPEPGMADEDLLGCIEWVALGFEICTSIYPDWRFNVSDAAATGVHVALLIGARHHIGDDRIGWQDKLASFSATLSEAAGASATGSGAQVLGSPLKAFGHLVQELARYGGQPLHAGDIVTTGTLTHALPAVRGEEWSAGTNGIDLAAIRIRLA